MNERCKRLAKDLKEGEAYFVTASENVFYLSGFRGEGELLVMPESAVLITDFRYIEDAKKKACGFCVADSGAGLGEIIPKNIDTLYIEDEHMTVAQLNRIPQKAPHIRRMAHGGGERINALRIVKDKTEIDKIAKAADIATYAFKDVLEIIKEGVCERELALEFEYKVKKAGAEDISFDTIVASGSNSSMPHAGITDRRLHNGDFVTMDFGCVYEGYCSDMTRTVAVGFVTDEQRTVYQTVLRAQLAALEAVYAGAACSDVDAVARRIISEAGYGNAFGHATGHGVGLEIHEQPRLSAKSEQILAENMTVTVEPGVYLAGRFGVRIEDLVIVKAEKAVNLSNFTKELLII